VSLFWSFVDYSLATNIMSKLINLFTESNKLDGPKNYKSWSQHMQNTLIYNELWRDIYDGDTAPTKPTDATSLEKWNLKDEKALALLRSFVTEHMFVHIENSKDAWSSWNLLKRIFDTLVASQKVDVQMKLLKQRLVDNGDVLEYISMIKNIHQEIIEGGFSKLEDSFLVSIVINGLSPSYKNFLETLQITDKLSTVTFDSLMLGMCYILCMCVCGARQIRQLHSDDPSSSALCVMCVEHFPRGVLGGAGMPPLVTRSVRGSARNFFFFFFFLVFAIFSGLLN
jgi:hypothetical protein